MKIVSIKKNLTTVTQICFVTEPPFDEERFHEFDRLQKSNPTLRQFDWRDLNGMLLMRNGFGGTVFMAMPIMADLKQCLAATEGAMSIKKRTAEQDISANQKQAEEVSKLVNIPLS